MCLEFLQVGDEEEDEDEGEEEPVSGCGEINDGQQEASEKDADGYSKKKDKRVVLWLRVSEEFDTVQTTLSLVLIEGHLFGCSTGCQDAPSRPYSSYHPFPYQLPCS